MIMTLSSILRVASVLVMTIPRARSASSPWLRWEFKPNKVSYRRSVSKDPDTKIFEAKLLSDMHCQNVLGHNLKEICNIKEWWGPFGPHKKQRRKVALPLTVNGKLNDCYIKPTRKGLEAGSLKYLPDIDGLGGYNVRINLQFDKQMQGMRDEFLRKGVLSSEKFPVELTNQKIEVFCSFKEYKDREIKFIVVGQFHRTDLHVPPKNWADEKGAPTEAPKQTVQEPATKPDAYHHHIHRRGIYGSMGGYNPLKDAETDDDDASFTSELSDVISEAQPLLGAPGGKKKRKRKKSRCIIG